MHPHLILQLAHQREAELERKLEIARLRSDARGPDLRRGLHPWRTARTRLQAGAGWLLVDLGLRLAMRQNVAAEDPRPRLQS